MDYEIINEHYKDFIMNLESYFNQQSNTIIYEKRNIIKRVAYEDKKYVVKLFKIPHFINKVAYSFFRDGKAKKSYKNSLKIIDFVPKPIAYIEEEKLGLLYKSYFVSEYFDYDFTIRELLTNPNFKDKNTIYQKFADFTYALHNAGIQHLDYSPGNVLIKRQNKDYQFKIIDINRMRFKTLTEQERLENFSKLWASDEDLTVIIKAYAKVSQISEDEALSIALKASQKHKDKKNLKKRLRGKEVVD